MCSLVTLLLKRQKLKDLKKYQILLVNGNADSFLQFFLFVQHVSEHQNSDILN